MEDTPQRLVERLSKEGEKVSAYYEGLFPQDWDLQVYSEGSGWTIRQILVHFNVTETSNTRLIRDILSGGRGAPETFDLNAFNEQTVANWKRLSSGELLGRFAASRQKTIELVRGLSEADLKKTGRHPFLGIAPLADIIKLLYLHNQTHLRDIRRILSLRGGQNNE
jgi:hypothetical protein